MRTDGEVDAELLEGILLEDLETENVCTTAREKTSARLVQCSHWLLAIGSWKKEAKNN